MERIVVGVAVGGVTYAYATKLKLLKAVLSGLGSCVAAVVVQNFTREAVGLPRERAPVEEWAMQYQEDAVEPELRVFDCHHHFFDFGRHDKPGIQGLVKLMARLLKPSVKQALFAADPRLLNNFGLRLPFIYPFHGKDLLEDISGLNAKGKGHNVVGTMYMECGWETPGVEECMKPAAEVDMVMEERRKHPGICQGIIAHADLRLGKDVEPLLKRYKENDLVKGIRYGLHCSEDPSMHNDDKARMDMAYDTKFREAFALLSKYGLTYDSWHFHVNLQAFTDLAKDFPQQTMICDHMGFPLGIGSFKREETFPVWKEAMKKLAQHKNVYVKIGGFGMRFPGFGFDERPSPPTSDELAEAWGPYVRYTIETFGVDRCMMESNFPMDRVSCSYTVCFNALKKTVAKYSQDDKRKLFELNALRVYSVKL